MAAKITTYGHILAYATYRGLMVASVLKHLFFSGSSRNPIRAAFKTLTPFGSNHPKFQNGCQEISILEPSLLYPINPEFLILHVEGFQKNLDLDDRS